VRESFSASGTPELLLAGRLNQSLFGDDPFAIRTSRSFDENVICGFATSSGKLCARLDDQDDQKDHKLPVESTHTKLSVFFSRSASLIVDCEMPRS
jgi:hypothetical protein